jgi:N-acetylglucosamine-6-sulfatase
VHKRVTRREALAVAGAAATAVLGMRMTREQNGRSTPPKILYLMTDDQPRYMASAQIMPKLDIRLRAEGIDFLRAYVSEPLCGPARASLLKGQYSHNTGIFNNGRAYQQFKARGLDQDTLATRLRAVGYKTAHFGKYINGYRDHPTYVPPGWHRWFTLADDMKSREWYKVSSATGGSRIATVKSYRRSVWHDTDLLAERVEGFIRSNAGIPWLAYVGTAAPHDPYYPAPHHERYADGRIYSSLGTEENTLEELSDKPRAMREHVPWTADEQAKIDWHTEGKSEELQAVDEAIERLVLALEETEQLANTLIVYCTDNGYMIGEHGLLRKAAPYEEATHVPFIVRGPDVARGIESDALVSHLDITATMLTLAGADTSGIDGRSLASLFGGTTPDDWRKRLLVEQKDVGWEMLREADYSYAEHSTGERELYDLASDPYELQSLHDDPTHQERVQAFSENLGRLRNAAGEELRAAEV